MQVQVFSRAAIIRFRGWGLPAEKVDRICDNLEFARRVYRQKRRDARRKPKTHLGPNDALKPEDITKLVMWSVLRAEKSRTAGKTMSREITDEMIVLLFLGSGLRAGEGTDLRIENTPFAHGRNAIDVKRGKGGRDRTVWISKHLAEKMIDYVKCEKNSKNYFFRNELGGRLSYGSLISKIRRIGRQSGVMVVEGQSWLSPHKFRHTFATLLLAATHDLRFVQEQLGHQQQKTTEIYINAAAGIFGGEMELFQKRLSFAENEGFLPYFIENNSQTAK